LIFEMKRIEALYGLTIAEVALQPHAGPGDGLVVKSVTSATEMITPPHATQPRIGHAKRQRRVVQPPA
jgi:hypothetical protein